MKSLKGRTIGNPYFAGTNKTDFVYGGVNLRTGNFTMSATDMSFEGGYGIPINVTRSYSSNNIDNGPMGVGWTVSIDVRTTAGGLLKSPGAPVRSTPVTVRRRAPGALVDPNGGPVNKPIDAIVSTDASGEETQIQRDVDGVLTPPAWDQNKHTPVWKWNNTDQDWGLLSDTVLTPEGTTIQYSAHGEMTLIPWNVTGHPSKRTNILKPDWIDDRHGNRTSYVYTGLGVSGGLLSFGRSDGVAKEQVVDKIVWNPGSDEREIDIDWQTYASDTVGSVSARVTSVQTSGKSVSYGYTDISQYTEFQDFRLTSVTTPGGKVTSYAWGGAKDEGGTTVHDGPGENLLITQVTDFRGLATKLDYSYRPAHPNTPDDSEHIVGVWRMEAPNGTFTYFENSFVGEPAMANGEYFPMGNPSVPSFMTFPDLYVPGTTVLAQASAAMSQSVTTVWPVPELPSTTSSPYWSNVYDPNFLTLLTETKNFTGTATAAYNGNGTNCIVTKTSSYNFLGNPLSEEVSEKRYYAQNQFNERTFKTEYAYHGADKYWQQKAVRVRTDDSPVTWRYAYTDYYKRPWNGASGDALGSYGMTKKVYDPKSATITVSDPDNWRDTVAVTGGVHSAEFTYDSKGRAEYVYKIAPNGTSYVTTRTTYGGPHGEADSVTEAYGSADARTTTTTAWNWSGKPTVNVDALGRQYTTTLLTDGEVDKVDVLQGTTSKTVVDYTYGTTGVEKDQVVSVDEKLSGVKQEFDYVDSSTGHSFPGAVGQVCWTKQSSSLPMATNVTAETWYTYDAQTGDRTKVRTKTPGGHNGAGGAGEGNWEYGGYQTYGFGDSPQRRFTWMKRLDSAGQPTGDQHWYSFDDIGRLWRADFAPSTAGTLSYQGQGHPLGQNPVLSVASAGSPAKVAEALYDHDAAGRTASVAYSVGTRQFDEPSGTYSFTWDNSGMRAYSAAYDHPLGLKTKVETFEGTGGSNWSEQASKEQTYTYEAERDYLVSATYDTGTSSWTYDAAGNRSNSGHTYDLLNRMSASPGHTYQHDILGNRTWRDYLSATDAQKTTWDEAGRMKTFQSVYDGFQARYRADGMRATKVSGLYLGIYWADEVVSGYYDAYALDRPTTRYYYDGQMPIEEDFTRKVASVDTVDLTRHGLGARGVDYVRVQRKSGSGSWTDHASGWPVYDTHGNNVGMLTLSGSSYAIGDERTYDAWGAVKTVNGSPPQQGYCANLGHRSDGESSLVYMRARYYEPGTGRFVSEDLAMDGLNWYVYCSNNPTNAGDPTGCGMRWIVQIGDFVFTLDGGGSGNHGFDLAIHDSSGTKVFHRWDSGSIKDGCNGQLTSKIIDAIKGVAKSGDRTKIAFLKRLLRIGGFGIDETLRGIVGGLAIFAITSLDAYFQMEPEDFLDTLRIIGMGGKI